MRILLIIENFNSTKEIFFSKILIKKFIFEMLN